MQLRLTDQEETEYVLMHALSDECKIDTTEALEYPPVAISMGEKLIKSFKGDSLLPIPICTYSNISLVQAPPKTKKTFFVSLLASAYLSGSNNFSGNIKGHRENKCIIHVDTEQGKWHAQKVFKRTIDMSGMKNADNYHTYALRTLSHKERIKIIDFFLQHKYENIGFVFIDGIADLVSDVNNLEECNACVQKLMEWSAKYDCHIMAVIHSNYGSDKPTGHLGSLLEKKAESQIQLEANTVNDGMVTVKCKRSRNFPFETFSFKINDFGYPEIVGDLYDPLK